MCLKTQAVYAPFIGFNQRIGFLRTKREKFGTFVDPNFDILTSIDIPLGADIFPLVLESGRLNGKVYEPVAINTVFGCFNMEDKYTQQSLKWYEVVPTDTEEAQVSDDFSDAPPEHNCYKTDNEQSAESEVHDVQPEVAANITATAPRLLKEPMFKLENMRRLYGRDRDCPPTGVDEIYAFSGLLFMAGMKKAQHSNTSEMWITDGIAPKYFAAVVAERRFHTPIRALRSDDSNERKNNVNNVNKTTTRRASIMELAKRLALPQLTKRPDIRSLSLPLRQKIANVSGKPSSSASTLFRKSARKRKFLGRLNRNSFNVNDQRNRVHDSNRSDNQNAENPGRNENRVVATLFDDSYEDFLSENVLTDGMNKMASIIAAKIESFEVNILVDSGSSMRCISQEFFDKIKETNFGVPALPANGVTVYEDVSFEYVCIVVPSLMRDPILGCDWMMQISIVVNFEKMQMDGLTDSSSYGLGASLCDDTGDKLIISFHGGTLKGAEL
ncbi:hypothetical protein JTB14_019956 [Gonioctena quinquepunctata]|nr:hypothetical protein JTB14_019956 [Gonioctena quinquepunctata]